MTCPRCNSLLVSCVGSDAIGERFQCRVCTNEWYDEVQASPKAPEPAKSEPSALEALRGVLTYCESRVKACQNQASIARERNEPNAYYQELGAQHGTLVIADFIRATIKGMGG